MSSSMQVDQSRHIKLEGTNNLRDLGGYPTKDGKITKWGKYFRSDSLHNLSPVHQQHLYEKGIRSVVDLRFSDEGKYQNFEQLPFAYMNVSLLDPATAKTTVPKTLVEMYCNMLVTSKQQIYQIMKHFADSGDDAVLFHCKVGKDRTGLIAAFLLDIAGVPRDVIVEDYALTSVYLPITEEAIKQRPAHFTVEQYTKMLQCEPEYMHEFLKYLDNHHGNAEGYLKEIGMTEQEIETLRDHFVVDKNEIK